MTFVLVSVLYKHVCDCIDDPFCHTCIRRYKCIVSHLMLYNHSPFKPSLIHVHVYLYFAQEQSQDCPDPWFTHAQSEDCAVNPWFVVQTMNPGFAQDNPWIAQIHASRITDLLEIERMLATFFFHTGLSSTPSRMSFSM